MAWYTDWFGTRYYKLLYGHRDEDDARAWVNTIVQKAGLKKGDEMLDMGCGRGRHALRFAEHGLRVTGIDISEGSVADARVEVPEVSFHVHDMREIFAKERFDAVVCLFTSLGYSNDRNDDQRAVNAAAGALKPGGRFVLDLLNGAIVRKDLIQEDCQMEGGVRFTLQRRVEGDTIVKDIHVDDKGASHRFTERVHAWTAEEVCALIERAGLQLDALTNGPEPTTFDPLTAERIVAWAHKPA
ncbi:MAG: class I SAM-dependent methyltransferase [Flavobacteriales bacterium]|nr:class I SAM-dependent methyltransferase [Flavobacteriales bacterium]